jgi:hypothetical protein
VVDTGAGEDTRLDSMAAIVASMADFFSALAQDFGRDITRAITHFIGEPRQWGGPTIRQWYLRGLQRIANRSNSNPLTGTTAKIRKAIIHTLKVAQAGG